MSHVQPRARRGPLTIWNAEAIPEHERKYAYPLKRFLFPAFDILVIVLGVRTAFVGTASVDRLFPPSVAQGLYWGFAVIGLLCLIGCTFPKLWRVEIVGKVAVFVLLTCYLVTLQVVTSMDQQPRDAVSVITLIAMLIPLLRLWILGIEERDRREG